jgi:excisionase family DNA binding protein
MNTERTSGAPITYIQSPFWTTEEAAAYCRVSINTMQHLLRIGAIPARRVGKQWRILKADLDVYLGIGPRTSDQKRR